MKRSGYTDLPLHYGHVPKWLSERMSQFGTLIIESLVYQFGKSEVLRRLSDPLWFQALGCVLGMDWHSSGITTSVMGALKKGINPISKQLGIYICGGRGKYSRQTPDELQRLSDHLSLDGDKLIGASKLSAKVDNTAIQDGYQLYLHNFIVTDQGEWTIIQQGMNTNNKMARRYHWHSSQIKSFIEEPHTGVVGMNQGLILNLTDKKADPTRKSIVELTHQEPDKMIDEIKKVIMPRHHEVREKDVNLKRLGSILALAYEKSFPDFTSFLLMHGVGPRTIQSLTLVSEVINGTPSRFNDPARFSFAHGGKDGHPFPVPLQVYDESIQVLRSALNKARLGNQDKMKCLQRLHILQKDIEKRFYPQANFSQVLDKEKKQSCQYGGRTVFGEAKPEP
ncbi:MAG: DUF763 domain-containing protein [Spirochaetes bacterium]|nr:DUF763 domain-containing protein [Spirochaetota bacterium]